MKVAFTTSTGTEIDLNFRMSDSFAIWDVNPDGAFYVTTVAVKGDAGTKEDGLAARADAIGDCAIVCAREIGGPAAAKLIARSIHPLRTGVNTPVEVIIGKLQQVLRGKPAPWMRKAQIRDYHPQGEHCHARG